MIFSLMVLNIWVIVFDELFVFRISVCLCRFVRKGLMDWWKLNVLELWLIFWLFWKVMMFIVLMVVVFGESLLRKGRMSFLYGIVMFRLWRFVWWKIFLMLLIFGILKLEYIVLMFFLWKYCLKNVWEKECFSLWLINL